MILSENGLNILKSLEGCKLTAYPDQGGVWTIGYGSTSNVVEGMVIDQQEADTRLLAKIAQVVNCVNMGVKVLLTQNKFDALVIFVYNIGDGAFHASTMLKLLNNGSYLAASEEFPKWDHAAHKENPGLLKRRLIEQKLFVTL
jgi:lysozyme